MRDRIIALAKETEESVDMLAERIKTAIIPVSPTGITTLSIVGIISE